MIDTIGFKVLIDEDSYQFLLEQITMTQRVDKKTGEIEFEYHNTKLDFSCPSWSYKVMVRITDEYWTYDETSRRPYKASGIPYISFEYSVPKILLGNNLLSVDPCLIYESMRAISENFEKVFGIVLPSPNDWYCYRLDTCANYMLENDMQVKNFINYLQRLNYPRKIKNSYEDTGLYFASRHHTLKVYWKGPEFKKHDMERFGNQQKAMELLTLATQIIRIEVEHRKRILYMTKRYERENGIELVKFEGYPRMVDLVEIFDFKAEHERIVSKILCGTESKVMKTMDAFSLLRLKYSERQARTFHHIYMIITTQGQKEAKKVVPINTYYRALRAFREVGLSLIVSDDQESTMFLDRGFPADFSLELDEGNKYYQKPLYECPSIHIEGEEEPF